ncbi:hypothetical protein [Ottowia testudinis]|uniref:Uncharacterized protein n=1 Tax=Ottowia testudinis TaxID=2816950 RepID=A0A975CD52_9BURK|nr:hypothetical protein [Ottowia testudinis]QTD43677.1 hypothetical protein J1M35_10905 [Ottowia testudinis]
MKNPRLQLILGLLAVALLIGLAAWTRQAPAPSASRTVANAMGELREEAGVIHYQPPAGQPGVPMQWDAADLERRWHLQYFIDHGYIGLRGNTEPAVSAQWIQSLGFPALQLAWPSLHMPPQPACGPGDTLAEACPVFNMRLISRASDTREQALLHAREPLPRQQQIPFEQRTASQWAAFYTRADGQWAGWLCDARRLQDQNDALATWGPEDGQWALPLGDNACLQASGWRERPLWRRWTVLSGLTEHPVLVRCSAALRQPPREDSGRGDRIETRCQALFEHAGRLIELDLPGRASGVPAPATAAERLRPQLIEAAWRTLQDAAAARVPTPAEALRREAAWCGELDAQSTRLRDEFKATRDQLSTVWNNPPLKVSLDPGSPCTRAFHRVLDVWLRAPAAAKPEAAWLAAARQVGDAVRRHTRNVPEPVWSLVGQLMERAEGPASPALLAWQAQQPWVQSKAEVVLKRYDQVGDGIRALPVPERIRLRNDLGHALSRSDHLNHPRTPDLLWAAADEWMTVGHSAGGLPTPEAVSLLTFAATYARQPSALPPSEAQGRLQHLVLGMEKLARQLAQVPAESAEARRIQVGTLAVHAAWHANHLALTGGDAVRWRAWLGDWAAWSVTALPPPLPTTQGARELDRGSAWIRGVALHRDAALAGKATDPDCPGGALLGCAMGIE